MIKPVTIAGQLCAAFGDIERMAKLYADDVVWHLPRSVPMQNPIGGKDAVIAFNREVWGTHYEADCEVDILDEVGGSGVSAARFTYRARMKALQQAYENEYTIFVRSDDQGIHEIFEGFDTAHTISVARGGA